jgi:hypothetical protein
MRKDGLVITGVGTKKLAMGHPASPVMRPTPPKDNFDNVIANVQVVKLADETINNSAVLQDDDELFFTLDANSEYVVEGHIDVLSGVVNIQDAFTYPADATYSLQMRVASYLQNGYYSVTIKFSLTTVSAGTLQYQWAQAVADASNTTVLAGSYLSYIKTPSQLI